jgi:hypothetical protein
VKKSLFFLALAFSALLPLAAQVADADAEHEFFVVNIPITRLYTHTKGYIVSYRKTSLDQQRVYLPLDWFKKGLPDANGNLSMAKAEIVPLKPGLTWPHLVVIYDKGAFSHVKLYLRPEITHASWGTLPSTANVDANFDVDEVKLDFGASRKTGG